MNQSEIKLLEENKVFSAVLSYVERTGESKESGLSIAIDYLDKLESKSVLLMESES